jgi:hypothetical protein
MIPADPHEDLLDHARLLGHDLIPSLAVTVLFADIAISKWCGAEDVDRPAARGVLLATAAPFHDLGPLVLGDHALDLDQEVLRGVIAVGVAEEDDLDAATGEFLEDQDLIGIFARETIRVLDVKAVEGSGGGLVAEPLQPRAEEQGPADAVVDEPQFEVAAQPVVADAPVERLELARDRVLLGLPIGGDSGVDRRAEMVGGHGHAPTTEGLE